MIIAIIQARMGSSRLPEKVLKKVLGKPLLTYQIERIKLAGVYDEIVIATTCRAEDDKILGWAEANKTKCFRGSGEDVLDRYYQAALSLDLEENDIITRLTADCPLLDPAIIISCVNEFIQGNYDYLSNTDPPTFPDGMDVEVFSFKTLKTAWENAKLPSEREHVTPYIRNHSDFFKMGQIKNEIDYSNFRLTVDEQEDYELISKIIAELYPNNKSFDLLDIIDLLEKHPEWQDINRRFERNEGYKNSLLAEQKG